MQVFTNCNLHGSVAMQLRWGERFIPDISADHFFWLYWWKKLLKSGQ